MRKQTGWRKFKHSIPRLIRLIPTRSHSDLRSMYKHCTDVMAGRRPSEISPDILRFHQAITEEWRRRTDELRSNNAPFTWPATDAPPGDGMLSGDLWRSQGVLSTLGYRVGMTEGRPEKIRRFLLDQAFSIHLPPLNGPDYMDEWGAPNTAARLHKLADTIAALTRNAKRCSSRDTRSACADWEADLDYLYGRYYAPLLRNFNWPTIEV